MFIPNLSYVNSGYWFVLFSSASFPHQPGKTIKIFYLWFSGRRACLARKPVYHYSASFQLSGIERAWSSVPGAKRRAEGKLMDQATRHKIN